MYNAYIKDSGKSKSLIILYNGNIASEIFLDTCDNATCQVNGNRISVIMSSPGLRHGRTYIMKENFCKEVQPMAIC